MLFVGSRDHYESPERRVKREIVQRADQLHETVLRGRERMRGRGKREREMKREKDREREKKLSRAFYGGDICRITISVPLRQRK